MQETDIRIDQEIAKNVFQLANVALIYFILAWIQKQDREFKSTEKISQVFRGIEDAMKKNNVSTIHDKITNTCTDGEKTYIEMVQEILNR